MSLHFTVYFSVSFTLIFHIVIYSLNLSLPVQLEVQSDRSVLHFRILAWMFVILFPYIFIVYMFDYTFVYACVLTSSKYFCIVLCNARSITLNYRTIFLFYFFQKNLHLFVFLTISLSLFCLKSNQLCFGCYLLKF